MDKIAEAKEQCNSYLSKYAAFSPGLGKYMFTGAVSAGLGALGLNYFKNKKYQNNKEIQKPLDSFDKVEEKSTPPMEPKELPNVVQEIPHEPEERESLPVEFMQKNPYEVHKNYVKDYQGRLAEEMQKNPDKVNSYFGVGTEQDMDPIQNPIIINRVYDAPPGVDIESFPKMDTAVNMFMPEDILEGAQG